MGLPLHPYHRIVVVDLQKLNRELGVREDGLAPAWFVRIETTDRMQAALLAHVGERLHRPEVSGVRLLHGRFHSLNADESGCVEPMSESLNSGIRSLGESSRAE